QNSPFPNTKSAIKPWKKGLRLQLEVDSVYAGDALELEKYRDKMFRVEIRLHGIEIEKKEV
ncbi:unnamed protein product, partial [marine sediment metagenome]